MARKALLLLLILLFATQSTEAEEIRLLDIGKDVDANLHREMRDYSWLEIYHMSENDPFTGNEKSANLFGRASAQKLRSPPDPFQRAFYRSYAKYLNTALDNVGMRSFLKRYEEWTKVDIRFNVSESWKSAAISEQPTKRNVYFETRAAVEVSKNGDSRVGLKFDPQGIDLDRVQNFTAFAEHASELGRLELRYGSFNKLSVLASKDDLFHIPALNISGEYKALDKRAYLGTAYHLDRDWQAKISGSYGFEDRDQSIILIFFRSLN